MDKKVKKYVDYVVNDLVKKTEIDIDNELIYFSICYVTICTKDRYKVGYRFLLVLYYFFFLTFHVFVSYVEKTYGVGMIEEINIIWDQYRVKLIKQINYLIE